VAFTSAEIVKIHRYMVWPLGWPEYAAIVVSKQSTTDGGTMTDGALETETRSILTQIASVEARLQAYWEQMEAGRVDEINVDSARAMGALRSEGRRLVRNLGWALNAKPLGDPFSGSVQ
jgi:hypothetical protein